MGLGSPWGIVKPPEETLKIKKEGYDPDRSQRHGNPSSRDNDLVMDGDWTRVK